MTEEIIVQDKEKVNEIESLLKNILPWSPLSIDKTIDNKLEQDPFLGGIYFFPISEITVANNREDIPELIRKRFLNILTASYKSQNSIVTVFKGEKGKLQIYIGFQLNTSNENTTAKPEVFQSIVEGVIPGSKTKLDKTINLPDMISSKKYGGIISGIPTIKIEDENQHFNIASVIRSLYGEEFVLAIISKPILPDELSQQFLNILNARDVCHQFAVQTKGLESGGSEGKQNSETITESKTLAEGFIANIIESAKVLFNKDSTHSEEGFWKGLTYSYSKQKSECEQTGKSFEEHWGQSLNKEIQNGMAKELEQIADNYLKRLKKGMNVGFWETSITFATTTPEGRNKLAGSFLGELGKPTDENFPAQSYFAPIDKDKILLIPKVDNISQIFPKSLCSYITSEELAQIASPPIESLPGYEIRRIPELSMTDTQLDSEQQHIEIGKICDYGKPIPASSFNLTRKDLSKHIFVCGLTGSGKSNTVRQLIKNIDVPFLVLESAKRDYRQLNKIFENTLRIHTIGDATVSPIQFNPFYIIPGISPTTHIDFLKAIFNASFSMYGPMPHIVEKCLHNIYQKKGWNLTKGIHPFLFKDGEPLRNNENISLYKHDESKFCFPTLNDLKEEVELYVNESRYRGELKDNIQAAIITRLESLCVGAKGVMFNTLTPPDIQNLLAHPTIFELEPLSDDDDKAFLVGLMLVFITEYRQLTNPATSLSVKKRGLEHLLIIEEAHRLLKNVNTERQMEMLGNPKGKAVETFCNVIAEMRALGQGVIVAEQIPTKIAPDVIKNTNTKIVHRLVSKDDQTLLTGSLNQSDEDTLYLGSLKTGHALCHKEGMDKPIEVEINYSDDSWQVSNENVKKLAQNKKLLPEDVYLELNEFKSIVGIKGTSVCIRFMNSILVASEGEILKTISKTLEDIESILKQKGYHDAFGKETISTYIIESCTSLFSQGIYSRNRLIPKNINAILKSILVEKQIGRVSELQAVIKEYWKTPSLIDYVQDIICELSLQRLLRKQRRFSDGEIACFVNNYFIFSCSGITNELVTKIKLRLGE